MFRETLRYRNDAYPQSQIGDDEMAVCEYFDTLRKNIPWCEDLFQKHIAHYKGKDFLAYHLLGEYREKLGELLREPEPYQNRDVATFMKVTRDFYDSHLRLNSPSEHSLTNLIAMELMGDGVALLAYGPLLVTYFSPRMFEHFFKWESPGVQLLKPKSKKT